MSCPRGDSETADLFDQIMLNYYVHFGENISCLFWGNIIV